MASLLLGAGALIHIGLRIYVLYSETVLATIHMEIGCVLGYTSMYPFSGQSIMSDVSFEQNLFKKWFEISIFFFSIFNIFSRHVHFISSSTLSYNPRATNSPFTC